MNYPTIELEQVEKILTIVETAQNDADYLDAKNCPYDTQTIGMLKRLVEAGSIHPVAAASVDPDKRGRGRPKKGPTIPMDEVEQEINDIRKELADLKIEGKTMEVSERIQIVRTRAALIERVLGMKERVADVKKYHAFVTTVIGIMETELPAKGRDAVLEQLRQYSEE